MQILRFTLDAKLKQFKSDNTDNLTKLKSAINPNMNIRIIPQ